VVERRVKVVVVVLVAVVAVAVTVLLAAAAVALTAHQSKTRPQRKFPLQARLLLRSNQTNYCGASVSRPLMPPAVR
jgi:Na+-transporting NADH:ubiquinone oxidoreductase subunit NqrC